MPVKFVKKNQLTLIARLVQYTQDAIMSVQEYWATCSLDQYSPIFCFGLNALFVTSQASRIFSSSETWSNEVADLNAVYLFRLC